MKFSIYLDDAAVSEIEAAAKEIGIGRAEWIRRACMNALHPETPTGTPPDTPEHLAQITADCDQAREDLAAAVVRIAVLEAEAKKDAEHIRSLQSAIATVATPTPPLLPETAGPGRRWVGARFVSWVTGRG